jgi:tRNA(Arg) A34 adenosine deaminase TadA
VNVSVLQNCIDKTFALQDLSQPGTNGNKHFSFIVRKHNVLSIGWNMARKTHTMAYRHGYPFPFIHSELAAIKNFQATPSELSRCILVNTRIIKGRIALAKPCKHCRNLLDIFEFKKIFYTTDE